MAKTSPKTSKGVSKSPQQSNASDPQPATMKSEGSTNGEGSKALAPPPRPNQSGDAPEFFSNQIRGSLSMEPNPFEQSFGGAPADTPNGTKLPPVAALTSPSSLLPNDGNTPFNWGGSSLRSGPLSPAMLSGPTNDYFGDSHLRGGFPTPNESSLRTGMTPGGSGSMFPAASPNTQAMFAQLQSGGATPSTLDFHRTAVAAAASKRDQRNGQPANSAAPPQAPTSVPAMPRDAASGTSAPAQKQESKAYDQDSNAANSLFLLAQGRGSAQPQAPFVAPPPPQAMAAPITVPQTMPIMAPVVPIPQQTPVPIPVVPGRPNGHGQNMSMVSGVNGALANGSVSMSANNMSMANGRRSSDANSAVSQDSDKAQLNGKGRAKRNSNDAGLTAGNRRKAQESAAAKNGYANKKLKTNGGSSMPPPMDEDDMDSQSDDDDDEEGKDGQPKVKMTEEEKRKNFLERNRVAALKCRQRKKQWLQNLQTKVDMYTSENETLASQITQLREEIVNLKTMLLAHKDCPVTQQQGLNGLAYMQQAPMDQFNPYAMQANSINSGPRRFS
ncbi:bzip transcription factor [Ophiostoma piceae UAMH 11346]|uniref:Bzip transcription factor n=1 Tax=Ophiostoma piceae (strain UAMH 11346) TaxID=1262450 RepID=S3CFB0_OPHP1|nr:bzip transcription factor [Ophiostoma piceae UAMH 11346]